jgi:hypothetical protein
MFPGAHTSTNPNRKKEMNKSYNCWEKWLINTLPSVFGNVITG